MPSFIDEHPEIFTFIPSGSAAQTPPISQSLQDEYQALSAQLLAMSSTSQPIDPARFAQALEDLPLSALHAKAAELRNSLFHLRQSNAQLQPFADEGDRDCAEAIAENETVMGRFRERVELLRQEVVERRHMPWVEWDEEDPIRGTEDKNVNGTSGDAAYPQEQLAQSNSRHHTAHGNNTNQGSGSLTDEELRRRLAAQMDEDDEGGLHL